MTSAAPARPYDLLAPEDRPYFDRLGDGLVAVLPGQRPGPSGWGRSGPPHGGAWVHLGPDGRARAFIGKVEVGQGTRTALSLLLAEELRLPLSAVDLAMGDTDLCPWDMGTFGSRSMPDAGEHLRIVGAAARAALSSLAAVRLGVPATEVELVDGVAKSAHRSIGYGELVRGLHRVEVVPPGTVPTPAHDWSRAGRPASDPSARDVVTGARRYTSDLRRPGMLHGKVLHPPRYGARLKSLDPSAAEAIPGVTVVREGDEVAVAAPDLFRARAALQALRAEWETPDQPSERDIVAYLRAHPAEGEDFWDVLDHATGDVAGALASAPVSLHATYTTAYLAHVPMETHAVVAEWAEGRLTVWMGTQTPFRARDHLADALGLAPDLVRILVPSTGSGFGGKHASELAVSAARLARAAGRPVRVAYTREEEFAQAYFRPMAVIDVRAGVAADGRLVAWEFHDLNAGSAAARTPYAVPNQKIDNQPAESPLAQGSYRALAATANNFARESEMDEIAARVGTDPVEYRLRHLADDRLAAVLRTVAERAGWTPRPAPAAPPEGRGRGMA